MDKEVYEFGTARVEIYEHQVWLQSGIMGLMLQPEEVCDLYDLLKILMEDEPMPEEDDDFMQLGEQMWIAVRDGMKNTITGEVILFEDLDDEDDQED